jgi:alpha-mannosidase
MTYDELVILLPCHSIEDFPLHHEGERAEGLLANWTALWHPALIASAKTMPSWRRAEDRFESMENKLILVPQVSEDDLPSGFAARAEKEGACLIRDKTDRSAILAEALEQLDGGDAGVDQPLAADFLALGYCYLQVELLTRLMRYASSLDEIHFQDQLIDAANAAVRAGSDSEAVASARDQLRSCFDTLSEERDHYYAVDSFILDLTVVAATTMGEAFREELAAGVASNIVLSADTLERMAREEPASLGMLRDAVAKGQVSVLGGGYGELELPLMSAEQILANLSRGTAVYEQHLAKRPTLYGRRRHGLTPLLPQILTKLGFSGALHATLDDGRFPEGTQARTQWEGLDGTTLDAIARVPLDAGRPETFLKLSATMGEYMDTDHVAIVLLAHWPGKASPWYDDLRRITRYIPALGTMTTLEQLFSETGGTGQSDRFTFDQYRTPYLAQAVRQRETDPISRHVRAVRRRAAAEACQALQTLVNVVDGRATAPVLPLISELDRIDSLGAENGSSSAIAADAAGDPVDEFEDRLRNQLEQTKEAAAALIPRSDASAVSGRLVFNPLSFSQRLGLTLPESASLPTCEKPVLSTGTSHGQGHVVVDVPSMGFAWIAPGSQSKRPPKLPKPLAEENVIRNEFIEAWINPETGSLRSVYDYKARGNRFSQQIGFRGSGPARESDSMTGDPDELANYSVMAADSVEVTASSAALGEITSRGRLMSREGKQLAKFRQTYQLWRGSRVLRLGIHLEPQIEPQPSPWKSYFACRFAWADEAADLYRSMHGCRRVTKTNRLEAPDYVEIEMGSQRTAILSGGLPYHRRVGLRMLDTLLIVKGETATHFQLGIGFDMPHPHQEAMGMLVDPLLLEQTAPPPQVGNSTWLFHVDAKNVAATRWEPLLEEGRSIGYRVRIMETTGQRAKTRIRSFRNVASARQLDFAGEPLRDCEVDGDAVCVELGGFEWLEIEARWQ